jgi:hypothetical protein
MTVPTPTPISRAMRRMPVPLARVRRTAAVLMDSVSSSRRSLPGHLVREPERGPSKHSRIIARSNLANTPIIWNIARPDGVPLLVKEQVDALRVKLLEKFEEIHERTSKSIDRPCRYHVDLAARYPLIAASSPGLALRPLALETPVYKSLSLLTLATHPGLFSNWKGGL